MEIKYYGHSCFVLVSSDGTSTLTDPYTKVGYELPIDLAVDVVTTSHAHFDHNYTNTILYKKLVNQSGAQTENIFGIESYHDPKQGRLRGNNIIYKITVDGIVFCHLGDLGEPISTQLIDKIGHVDVLMIPVGGTYTIDARQAKEYVDMLNPKTVIPMHYKPMDGTLDIASADEFLSFFPKTDIEYIPEGKTTYVLNDERKVILYMERIKQ